MKDETKEKRQKVTDEIKAKAEAKTIATLNLYQKLVKATEGIGYIKKGGENRMQGYKFLSAEQIVAEVRKSLIANRLYLFVTTEAITELENAQTKSNQIMYRVRVDILVTVVNADNPDEKIEVKFSGLGQDMSDKAITKGYTFALKYALRQIFLIETLL